MTHYFGDNQTTVLNTWFFQNLQLNKLDVLSNGDLVAQINIVKADYFIDSSDTSIYFNNFIARINKETGKLIWAYAYFFNGYIDQHIPNSFKVINDMIWSYGYFGVTTSSFSNTSKFKVYKSLRCISTEHQSNYSHEVISLESVLSDVLIESIYYYFYQIPEIIIYHII